MTSTLTRPVVNVVIATKGLQDRSINILDGTTVENKGQLFVVDETYIYKKVEEPVMRMSTCRLPKQALFYKT